MSAAEFEAPQPAATQSADLLSVTAAASATKVNTSTGLAPSETVQELKQETASPPPTSSMEFLPLMMVSVYCSIGVIWAWLRASALYLLTES